MATPAYAVMTFLTLWPGWVRCLVMCVIITLRCLLVAIDEFIGIKKAHRRFLAVS